MKAQCNAQIKRALSAVWLHLLTLPLIFKQRCTVKEIRRHGLWFWSWFPWHPLTLHPHILSSSALNSPIISHCILRCWKWFFYTHNHFSHKEHYLNTCLSNNKFGVSIFSPEYKAKQFSQYNDIYIFYICKVLNQVKCIYIALFIMHIISKQLICLNNYLYMYYALFTCDTLIKSQNAIIHMNNS